MIRSRLVETLQSVTGRLLCWFLALSLVPAGVLTVVQYRLASSSLRKSAAERLRGVASARAARLDTFAQDRLAVVSVLTRAPSFVEAAIKLDKAIRQHGPGSPEYLEEVATHGGSLAYIAESLGHPNVMIFASDGTLLIQRRDDLKTGPNLREGPLKDSALRTLFDRVINLLNPDISRFETYEGSTDPLGFLATPLFGGDGKLLGAVVLQLDQREVFRVFRDHDGLGRSGEAQAVVWEPGGSFLRVLSPPRVRVGVVARATIRLGRGEAPDDPLWQAVEARRGSGVVVDQAGNTVLADWSFVPAFQWGLVVKQDASEALALVNVQRNAAVALLGITLVVAGMTAPLVATSLARPIRSAAALAAKVARGDLTGKVARDAVGEPGLLLRSLAAMTEYLRGLIGRITGSSQLVLNAAERIAEATKEQERTIQESSTATYQTAASVHEISGTSKALLETMDEVNGLASRTAKMADEGQGALRAMAQSMSELAEATGTIRERLGEIRHRSQEINMVLGTVTKLADQTDLLSLNAAIEAEKAGGAASGFRVVAREIRHLADQSAIATLEIEKIVKGMQRSAEAGVGEMQQYDVKLEQGVQRVGDVSERLESILGAVRDLTPRFDQVTEGMRVQAEGASQIRLAMESLRDRTTRSGESVRAFKEAASQLQTAANALKDDVARFQVDIPT